MLPMVYEFRHWWVFIFLGGFRIIYWIISQDNELLKHCKEHLQDKS